MANPPYKTPPSNRLTVSSLLSPPEMKRSESFGSTSAQSSVRTPFSSFNSEPSKAMAEHFVQGKAAASAERDAYASPPISPFVSQKENIEPTTDNGSVDPQLFAASDTASSIVAPNEPLFPQEPQVDHYTQKLITEHMKRSNYPRGQSRPAPEDYAVTLQFISTVHQNYNKDPAAWRRQERSYLDMYGRPSGIVKKPAERRLAPAPSLGQRQKKVAIPRAEPRAPRAAPKRTPKARVLDSFDDFLPTASPKPARPVTNRDDTDFNSLPDFSPPLNTLPNNSKVLKADWRGAMLDLSNDPDRERLHEAEINLASTLRLTCATYLCSKRRIFQARIDALRIGKEFRKTDAQQACKIDVNKASKLWTAYDKVGWFNPEYFRQFL
ncbi:hypothetical protein P154DRAFT_429607 [Amniculicola lignicola CBS 123094]|uniref:SWIRM domain-containing protein n=1 Tax=Amniculicola lignicola CBS 123094 TaxID=1392246 RepID=A0A6A5WLX3_9PLEO|nr:hypothetical protein P154DRAFT_429607 [Amniculicola lignicola CBS 123094]